MSLTVVMNLSLTQLVSRVLLPCMCRLLACESLHVCTVCIWRCEQARFCVEVFYALYLNFHSFIHRRIRENGHWSRPIVIQVYTEYLHTAAHRGSEPAAPSCLGADWTIRPVGYVSSLGHCRPKAYRTACLCSACRACACVRVCVRARERMCVCACVRACLCVCVDIVIVKYFGFCIWTCVF